MADEFDRLFKDDVEEDLGVFVDVTEFGELCWVDGVLLRAQVITGTSENRRPENESYAGAHGSLTLERTRRQNKHYAGLHGDYTIIYFPTAVYCRKKERLPRNGEYIHINGRRFDVVNSRDEQGMAKILATAYRQNTLRDKPFVRGDAPLGALQ